MFRRALDRRQGAVQVNRGYRIEFDSGYRPLQGRLRLHPSVNHVGFSNSQRSSSVSRTRITTISAWRAARVARTSTPRQVGHEVMRSFKSSCPSCSATSVPDTTCGCDISGAVVVKSDYVRARTRAP